MTRNVNVEKFSVEGDIEGILVSMSIETKTFDEMALDALLAGKPTRLPALLRLAEGKIKCPECGKLGPHEDNGQLGVWRTLLCTGCRHQWEA